MVFHLWEELIFLKIQNMDLPSFKEVLKKVSDAYKDQRENIIKQKDLIIKNLDLKKNSVLNQDLEPILEMSLSYLDNKKEDIKVHQNFQLLIYMKLCFIFIINQMIKNI